MGQKNRIDKLLIVEWGIGIKNGHFQTTPIETQLAYRPNECHLLLDDEIDNLSPGTFTSFTKIGKNVRFFDEYRGYWADEHPTLKKIKKFIRYKYNYLLGRYKDFSEVLYELIRKNNFQNSDVVVFPSLSPAFLPYIIQIISELDTKYSPVFIVRLLAGFSYQDYHRVYGVTLVNQLVAEKKIILCCDSETVTEVAKTEYGYQMADPWILPLNISPFRPETIRAVRRWKAGEVFRIGVYGGPRQDKGSDRIASIAQALRYANSKAPENAVKFEFLVQADLTPGETDPLYESLAALPTDLDGVRITPLGPSLSGTEFIDAFMACDVVLLPYSQSKKRLVGSGIVVDAVFARKPLIYTTGMSMIPFMVHGNALQADSDDEIANAIVEISDNYQEFAMGADKAFEFAKLKVENPPLPNAHY
ncbi:hypothetical protein [Pseudovibrio sp. SPO723]|uniref:hypothetical protein n=1 Tax=Nesiotobacter zosterae TaxID=392721 RepID=UPI0029C27B43|nr:hypothetical protein [Pseudovibrio sp. SPO723]MDX5593348.1 hypothetical protein [Pseudovibrio sp. SPO723]